MVAESARPFGFARKASGLARSVSSIDAMLMGISWSGIGLIPIYLVWAEGSMPAAILPGLILFLIFAVFHLYSYTLFAVLMPRSGGEYVYVTRTLTPGIGFLANWSTVVWMTFWIAWNGYYLATFALPMGLATVGYSLNSAFLISIATTISTNVWSVMLIGSILIWGLFFLLLAPVKAFLWYQKILFTLTVVATIVSIVLLFSTSIGDFSSSFNSFVAPYTNAANPFQQVITDAQGSGFLTNPSFDATQMFQTLGIWSGIMLYAYAGTFLGGEIKDVKKSSYLMMPLGLVLMVVITILWDLGMTHAMGPDFLHAVNYLYYNNPSALPLQIPPMVYFLAALTTKNAVLIWLMSLTVIFGNMLAGPMNTIVSGRSIFAWSMDKLVPAKLSSVNRYHSPTWSTFLCAITGFFWLWIYVFIPGLTTFSAALGVVFTFGAVTLAIAIVPWRQKDLFEASPIKWRIGGIPLVTIIGAIAFAFIVLITGLYLVYPVYGANSATSLTTVAVVLAVGIAVYLLAKAYRKRQGIDLSLLYKEIPPI